MVDKSSTVSIPKGKDDPSYRYKRDVLKISYQGNLRTKLDNIVEVAHSLIIPPDYPLKFIGYELGSQTDIKSNEYTINGKHPLDKLEDLLEKFIAKYILCQSKDCGLPETKIFVKNNEIKAKCTACPHTSTLDNRHKMASYILKNPPTITTKIVGKEVKETNNTKQDKDLDLKAIKNYTKKMNEENSKGNQSGLEALVKPLVEDKVPGMTSPDIKYFVLVHGLYGNDIYEAYDQRSEFLKFVS